LIFTGKIERAHDCASGDAQKSATKRDSYILGVTGCVNLGGFFPRGFPSRASANFIERVSDLRIGRDVNESCGSG